MSPFQSSKALFTSAGGVGTKMRASLLMRDVGAPARTESWRPTPTRWRDPLAEVVGIEGGVLWVAVCCCEEGAWRGGDTPCGHASLPSSKATAKRHSQRALGTTIIGWGGRPAGAEVRLQSLSRAAPDAGGGLG